MSKKTELEQKNKENKPVPTENPGTNDENKNPEIKKIPTGNMGTFSINDKTGEIILEK